MGIVLIELPGGEGVVRRDDGEIVVCGRVSDGDGQPLRAGDRYRPAQTGLDPGRCLVGGLLPPGAVGAEVVDARGARVVAGTGGGAYAAILKQPHDGAEPIVCCRDGAGAPVRRPLPARYPCTPVLDTDEPCPACGAVDYEECVPNEYWRGGRAGPDGTTVPSPIVVCRVCGHEEREGSIQRISSPDGEDEAARAARMARWQTERRVQRWYENQLTLRAVTFPIYAAEGWPAAISGSGSRNDELTELTIAHTDSEGADLTEEQPRLEVTTSTENSYRDEEALARRKLEFWIEDEIDHPHGPDLSGAALLSAVGLVTAPDDVNHLQVDHREAPHLPGQKRAQEQRPPRRCGHVPQSFFVHRYSGIRRQPGRSRAL